MPEVNPSQTGSGGGTGASVPASGGGGGAGSYEILASNRSIQVLSATLVQDVEEVHCRTLSTGCTFTRAVEYKNWLSGKGSAVLETIAQNIDGVFSTYPEVVSGSAVQDVDASNLLVDAVAFVVQVYSTDGTRGPFSDTVTLTVVELHKGGDYSSSFKPVLDRLSAEAG